MSQVLDEDYSPDRKTLAGFRSTVDSAMDKEDWVSPFRQQQKGTDEGSTKDGNKPEPAVEHKKQTFKIQDKAENEAPETESAAPKSTEISITEEPQEKQSVVDDIIDLGGGLKMSKSAIEKISRKRLAKEFQAIDERAAEQIKLRDLKNEKKRELAALKDQNKVNSKFAKFKKELNSEKLKLTNSHNKKIKDLENQIASIDKKMKDFYKETVQEISDTKKVHEEKTVTANQKLVEDKEETIKGADALEIQKKEEIRKSQVGQKKNEIATRVLQAKRSEYKLTLELLELQLRQKNRELDEQKTISAEQLAVKTDLESKVKETKNLIATNNALIEKAQGEHSDSTRNVENSYSKLENSKVSVEKLKLELTALRKTKASRTIRLQEAKEKRKAYDEEQERLRVQTEERKKHEEEERIHDEEEDSKEAEAERATAGKETEIHKLKEEEEPTPVVQPAVVTLVSSTTAAPVSKEAEPADAKSSKKSLSSAATAPFVSGGLAVGGIVAGAATVAASFANSTGKATSESKGTANRSSSLGRLSIGKKSKANTASSAPSKDSASNAKKKRSSDLFKLFKKKDKEITSPSAIDDDFTKESTAILAITSKSAAPEVTTDAATGKSVSSEPIINSSAPFIPAREDSSVKESDTPSTVVVLNEPTATPVMEKEITLKPPVETKDQPADLDIKKLTDSEFPTDVIVDGANQVTAVNQLGENITLEEITPEHTGNETEILTVVDDKDVVFKMTNQDDSELPTPLKTSKSIADPVEELPRGGYSEPAPVAIPEDQKFSVVSGITSGQDLVDSKPVEKEVSPVIPMVATTDTASISVAAISETKSVIPVEEELPKGGYSKSTLVSVPEDQKNTPVAETPDSKKGVLKPSSAGASSAGDTSRESATEASVPVATLSLLGKNAKKNAKKRAAKKKKKVVAPATPTTPITPTTPTTTGASDKSTTVTPQASNPDLGVSTGAGNITDATSTDEPAEDAIGSNDEKKESTSVTQTKEAEVLKPINSPAISPYVLESTASIDPETFSTSFEGTKDFEDSKIEGAIEKSTATSVPSVLIAKTVNGEEDKEDDVPATEPTAFDTPAKKEEPVYSIIAKDEEAFRTLDPKFANQKALGITSTTDDVENDQANKLSADPQGKFKPSEPSTPNKVSKRNSIVGTGLKKRSLLKRIFTRDFSKSTAEALTTGTSTSESKNTIPVKRVPIHQPKSQVGAVIDASAKEIDKGTTKTETFASAFAPVKNKSATVPGISYTKPSTYEDSSLYSYREEVTVEEYTKKELESLYSKIKNGFKGALN